MKNENKKYYAWTGQNACTYRQLISKNLGCSLADCKQEPMQHRAMYSDSWIEVFAQ